MLEDTPAFEIPQEGLVLRDGSTANIRVARADDAPDVAALLQGLSGSGVAIDEARNVSELCATQDPRAEITLVVTRRHEDQSHVIALASYARREDDVAALSLAVAEAWRGLGVASRLLEKLAGLAAHHGFRRFRAEIPEQDEATLAVFVRSGLFRGLESDADVRRVDLTVVPDAAGQQRAEIRDRLYTTASIRPFFRPNAVAVVGAGRDRTNLGHRILASLHRNEFQGPVYVVNPHARVVGSFRTYASLEEIPDRVDLVVIAVPHSAVPDVVSDAARAGVRALVLITAGYAETGEAGSARQAKLLDAVRGHGMRLVGPNCMGLIDADPSVRLAATFAPIFPPHGRVAMLSQSGALGVAILQFARDLHLGLSSFVSVGNKADVSGNDMLQYWEEDPGTDVILLYLESFGNPRRFARIARRISRHKPIVVVKSGRTGAGERAAGSHTASLAGSDAGADALFRQTGVLRADTLEEMFHMALVLANQPLPAGNRVAILTNAGGPAILVADALEHNGLCVEPLPSDVSEELRTFLPAEAGLGNPVDMIASAGPAQYRRATEVLLACDAIDALIVIDVPLDEAQWDAIEPELLQGIEAGLRRATRPKPVLACVMGAGSTSQPVQLDGGIPCFPFPEAAARVLARVTDYAMWRRTPEGDAPAFRDTDMVRARAACRETLEGGGGWLSARASHEVLEAAGIQTLPGGVAQTAESAADLADTVGYPVAVKLSSQSITHKTDVGGVKLHLADRGAVLGAFREIEQSLRASGQSDAMDGVLVQPMVQGGCELLVGVADDPVFGSLIAFGLGGIYVEVLRDVQFRVAPLTTHDAHDMVRSIRGWRLLEGYRAHPPADIEAIEDVLLRISHLVESVPQIVELDLNPLLAMPPGQGCQVVDVRIRVRA